MKKVLLLLLCCVFVSSFSFINNANAKEGTLLVAFGTSMEEAKPALLSIEEAFKKANVSQPILMAYTSDIIRRKLDKLGTPVLSVNAALTKLATEGVSNLTIQSLHVLPAEEYMQLERMIIKFLTKNPNTFQSVKVGYPLLLSKNDMDTVVKAMLYSIPSDLKPEDAILFMAHGNDRGPGDLALYALNEAFQKNDPLAFVAAVEGAVCFDDVFEKIKASGAKRVWLKPFMIVAGDHARNDLAGEEADSWASLFKSAGIEPMVILEGMGEMHEIQQLFVEHAKNAVVDLANTNKAD